jgi:hypothetical protein
MDCYFFVLFFDQNPSVFSVLSVVSISYAEN